MIVQTGIKWEDVNQILADKNIPLFFPVSPNHHVFHLTLMVWKLDPGPGATIGGMISTGCSGSKFPIYSLIPPAYYLGSERCEVRNCQRRMVPKHSMGLLFRDQGAHSRCCRLWSSLRARSSRHDGVHASPQLVLTQLNSSLVLKVLLVLSLRRH